MTIKEDHIKIKLTGSNISHFESLKYQIPRTIDKKGRLTTPINTTIIVSVSDLMPSSHVYVTKVCDICGNEENNIFYHLILKIRRNGDGLDRCRNCSYAMRGLSRRNNVKYENSLEYYCVNSGIDSILREFSNQNNKKPSEISKGSNTKFFWDCFKCKRTYPMVIRDKIRDRGCPYCSNHRIDEKNCFASTHPNVHKLMWDLSEGYKYSAGSGKKVAWKCPKCHLRIKNKEINQVIKYGISCPRCSDGISYPEKFMFHLLEQLNESFETQVSFKWSNNKKYDFYIPNINLIIETHGMQHYNGGFERLGGRTLEEEQENDKIKGNLALKNGINNYVVIDCRNSDMEFVNNNILNSNLKNLFDLSMIDWIKCHEYACNTLVKDVCDLWNSGIRSTSEIGELLNLDRVTSRRYLKRGAKIGWCNYDPNGDEIREYKSSKISKAQYKQVVQLNLDGSFIYEFDSVLEAKFASGVNHISSVCRGMRKTAGGFKWMYKTDYEKITL